MKKMNKKGFTIVELVIVIAVIAILAAVLIPTYSSLVKKANVSADEQAVRQMNTALAIYTAENGAPSKIAEVKEALREGDINVDTLAPVAQGYAFYWDNENNKVVLVGEGKATAKSGWILLTSTGYGVEPTETVTNIETLAKAFTQSETAGTVLVKLQKDITVNSTDFSNTINLGTEAKPDNIKAAIVVESGQSLILDMNGYKIADQEQAGKTVVFYVEEGGQLVVKNAEVDGFRAFWNNGTLTLNGVKSTCKNAVVRANRLSDTTIIDCEFTSTDNFVIATNNGQDEPKSTRITIIDSVIESKGTGTVSSTDKTKADYSGININIAGMVRIEGSTVKGLAHGAYIRGCNAYIKDSSFKSTYTGNENTNTKWGTGNNGPYADLVLASGNNDDYKAYTTYVAFTCENVQANKVIVHEPAGGHVSISGIEGYHECHLPSGQTCNSTHSG